MIVFNAAFYRIFNGIFAKIFDQIWCYFIETWFCFSGYLKSIINHSVLNPLQYYALLNKMILEYVLLSELK